MFIDVIQLFSIYNEVDTSNEVDKSHEVVYFVMITSIGSKVTLLVLSFEDRPLTEEVCSIKKDNN